jgi:putative two-component system response regulator
VQVLVVDDDEFALSMVENTLARMGFSSTLARNGAEAVEILQRGEIRLMITDWDMPQMNGLDLCKTVRREALSGYVYIIMLTGREGAKQRMEGLYAGADDFLNKPLDPEELLICLKQAERILALETRDVTLFALAKLAESRDIETGAHLERVQNYSRLIAQHLASEVKARHGVDDDYIRLLYQTSPLHDLGKVSIPDAILLKPDKLSNQEYEIMKTHAMLGAQTLDAALAQFPNIPFLQMARDIAAMHHEKFDGSGYPQGLVGEQIPLCARIVALADSYDAITSKRVYKEALSHETAKGIILRDRGSHFDPEVVDAFLRAESAILTTRERIDLAEVALDATSFIKPPAVEQFRNSGTILVVEDDALILARLRELLATTGEEVLTASNGEEALRILEDRKPRIVISDWVMPGVDGLTLCRKIRAGNHADRVYFIMLTAHSDKSRLLEAYDAGVDDFISKPFGTDELLAHIRAGIRNARLHDESLRKIQGSQTLNAQLASLNSRLERLSITDELTGVFNRRQAMSRMEEQWGLSTRYRQPLSVVAIDIDHFKRINDTHGHDAGDAVLRQVADALRESKRGTDTLCRIGGEEFLIIYPCQTEAEARICAERCRRSVENHKFRANGLDLHVTISLGVVSRTPAVGEYMELLRLADEALYAAKHAGRNRICTLEDVEAAQRPDESSKSGGLHDQAVADTNPPIDLAAVLTRCSGDHAFVASIMEKFQTRAADEVSRIQQSMQHGHAETLQRAAHNLKSMAAFVSAEQATILATKIEDLGREHRLNEVPQVLEKLREEVDRTVAWIASKGPGSLLLQLTASPPRQASLESLPRIS